MVEIKGEQAPTKEHVTHMLLRYLAMGKKIKTAEAQRSEIYSEICKLHDAGQLRYNEAKVRVDTTEDRRRIKWKVECVDNLGEEKVSEIEQKERETFTRHWVSEVVDGQKQVPSPPVIKRKYPSLHVVK